MAQLVLKHAIHMHMRTRTRTGGAHARSTRVCECVGGGRGGRERKAGHPDNREEW